MFATRSWRGNVLLACVVMIGAARAAIADGFEPHTVIRKAASEYALAAAKRAMPNARLTVHTAALDPRLRLPLCDRSLHVSAPSSGRAVGNTVVSVRCGGQHPWKLYVPLTVNARLPVLVAAQPLARGTQVSASMLSRMERDVAQLPYGYFTQQAAVVGQVLTRNLAAGEALTPGVLRPPLLVRRGQTVTLIAGTAVFSVSTQGVALQNGARGALVRVRNSRSKRVVQGVVTAAGQVRVEG